MTTGSSRSSHPIMKLFDIGIIKRIYITQSQQHPTHHMFYVYCIDESSTQHLPYFYIRVDELHYLATLPPLPTQHTPLTWSKYVKPSIRMCSLCYSPDHVHSRCPHRNDPSIRFCATCGSSSHLAKQCHAVIICKCCEKAGHNVLECTRFRPSYTPLQLAPNLSAFPPLTSTSASPTSTSSSPLSWSSVVQRSALRDTSSPSPPHKRMRHTSFDSDSVSSYNSRDNHSPLSPAFQEYLDQSSLTRSSSNSSLSSRSPTPSPSRSSSRSSRSSSSQSTSSDAALIKMLQQTIQQQQQQITQLQQQLQQLLQLTKQTSNSQQQRQPPPPPQQQQQQQQQRPQQLTNAHVMSD